MKKQELLLLGFKDKSYMYEDEHIENLVYENGDLIIEIYGNGNVDFKSKYHSKFVKVPNCHTIEDVKVLIKLFK